MTEIQAGSFVEVKEENGQWVTVKAVRIVDPGWLRYKSADGTEKLAAPNGWRRPA